MIAIGSLDTACSKKVADIARISSHSARTEPCDQTCYHFLQKAAQGSRNPGVTKWIISFAKIRIRMNQGKP
jgi:hypothetical protein